MSLSRQEVEKISLLARLQLCADELERMTVQMGQIVAYVESLAELNTDNVEPMAHALDVANVFAADELRRESGPRRRAGQRAAPRFGVLPGSGRAGRVTVVRGESL